MGDLVLEDANLKEDEKLFFKFRMVTDYNIEAVVNNYLYFTEPSKFRNVNDPSDFKIKIDFHSTEEHILSFIKYMNKLCKATNKTFPYQTVADFRKNMSEKKLNKLARETGDKTPQEHLDEIIDKYRIYCVADYWKSDFFWDSDCFCKNYEGFCIGYKATDLFNQKTYWMECNELYEPGTMVTVKGKYYFNLPKVYYDKDDTHTFDYWDKAYDKYGNYNPYAPDSTNTKNIIYNFLHKYEKFSDEHEYRPWFLTENDTHKIYIPKENIKCIIFGMNCADYLNIKSQIQANNPTVTFYKQILDSDGHVNCIRL